MSKQVQMPDIGGDEVTLVSLRVKVGDVISEDQEIATVEGDKASMDVPAPVAGKVVEVFVKEGDLVSTGVAFYAVEAAQEASAPAQSEPAPVVSGAVSVKEASMPDIGGDEVTLVSLRVKEGDVITEDQEIATVEGDKASMDVPAPLAGKVVKVYVKEGDKVKTGVQFYAVEVAGAAPASAPVSTPATPTPVKAEAPVASTPVATTSSNAAVGLSQEKVEAAAKFAHATPMVRRTAREYGVDLDKVQGTGNKNRITPEDVLKFIRDAVKQVQTGAVSAASVGAGLDLLPWPKVDFSKFGEVEVKEMGKIPKISAKNLHRNWVVIPHVTHFDSADITELEAFRQSQNKLAEKRKLDVKYTPLVFIMKAVAKALEKFPKLNASLNAEVTEFTFKKYIHLGIAVDTPNGLVVPVIRDVNKKGVVELSRELAAVSKKARDGKLTASDMTGGCFTISSLGGIGTTAFTPIINAPEVGILGVSRSKMDAVWDGKQFTPRLMLPLSLSFDHRALDGAEAARFLQEIIAGLSDLRTLIM